MTEHRIPAPLRTDRQPARGWPHAAAALWQEMAEAFRALHAIQFAAPWKDAGPAARR